MLVSVLFENSGRLESIQLDRHLAVARGISQKILQNPPHAKQELVVERDHIPSFWRQPFSVELPGIEPVSGCWSRGRTRSDLQNDIPCDSPELTSVDTERAQNAPSQSFD